MSNQRNADNDRLLKLLDEAVEGSERLAKSIRDFAIELRSFRLDLQDHERRIRKLEGDRRG